MTEAEWASCTNPKAMLTFLAEQRKASERQYRLFACACFRRVWHALTDPHARQAVEVAERYADGLADEAERETILTDVANRRKFGAQAARWAVVAVARTAAVLAVDVAGQTAACLPDQEYDPDRWAAETPKQCDLLRDIWGPLPFRPVAVAASYRTAEVLDLAQTIYNERGFDRMLELGQALHRAGCNDREMLQHCVWSEEHTRGCWLIDLLLAKEVGQSKESPHRIPPR
jgi:hypothetical protein